MASGTSTANLPAHHIMPRGAKSKGTKPRTRARMAPIHGFSKDFLTMTSPPAPADRFTLDPRLAADTLPVAALGLSDLRLMNDRRFPWLILVPRRAGAAEIIDLADGDRAALLGEIVRASEALRAAAQCDKLNVGALGNIVRQLHIHVVARVAGDAAWPGPVWGSGTAIAYMPGEAGRLIAALHKTGLA